LIEHNPSQAILTSSGTGTIKTEHMEVPENQPKGENMRKIMTHKKSVIAGLLCSTIAALTVQQATAATIVDFSFDDTANDTGVAFQHFDNATGTSTADLTTGQVSSSSTAAAGFNTVSSIDLSSYSGFTVGIVVESSNFDITIPSYNGSFFGIATGPNANATDGSALWQNAGTTTKPSIGVQFGDAGRGTAGFVELAVDAGGYSFTQLIAAPTVSADDGFTLSLTFTDNGTGDAGVTVTSTGMDTDINYSGTVGFTYASFADTVSGNISSQGGGAYDLASYRIVSIPEPATLGLISVFGGSLLCIRRRFML
jgi:hypothetical protein